VLTADFEWERIGGVPPDTGEDVITPATVDATVTTKRATVTDSATWPNP